LPTLSRGSGRRGLKGLRAISFSFPGRVSYRYMRIYQIYIFFSILYFVSDGKSYFVNFR
jgi:hypothetical protein